MKLGDLVGIVHGYVRIHIDCPPINEYEKTIYGKSERLLFKKFISKKVCNDTI